MWATADDGCRLWYETAGPDGGPSLLFSHALGTTHRLWDRQMDPFSRSFRVLRYDARGHGGSGVPRQESTVEQLGRDAIAVLDAAGVRRAHVCGLSMGGQVAMWMAIHAPDRVDRIVLANTARRIGSDAMWSGRIADVRARGMADLAVAAMARWFSAGFRSAQPEVVARFQTELAGCNPEGYAACCAALRDADLTDALSAVRAPALALTGSHDAVTTSSDAEALRDALGAGPVVLLDAAHLSNVEQADAFNLAVVRHLGGH